MSVNWFMAEPEMFFSYRRPWCDPENLFSVQMHRCMTHALRNVLKCSFAPTFIALELSYPVTSFMVYIKILLNYWLFFFFFNCMVIENKHQNSVERQQVDLTQLVVCSLEILRHNYPLSTCLNRKSGFTCSAPGLEWILKVEIHGKAIQVPLLNVIIK